MLEKPLIAVSYPGLYFEDRICGGGWCALWESQWTKLSCYGSKGARALWPGRVGVVL